MKEIEFFFDVGSPYTYLCSTQIDAVAAKHGVEVRWRPFLLGGVFKATGNEMPARVPAKAAWMLQDLKTWAKHYGVPFEFPPSFPPNTLRAMRACIFADSAGRLRPFARSLFEAYWVRGIEPSSDDALAAAARAAGLEANEVVAACDTQAVKDALRKSTDEAVSRGAFGAPTIFVGDRMFWGNDRLVLIDQILAGTLG